MEMNNCGIYKIICLPNNREYIGSTNNWHARRLVHISQLRKGKHHNQHLQRAWNKYGKEAFVFHFDMNVNEESLLIVENIYLAANVGGFNIAKYAEAPFKDKHHSVKSKAAMGVKRIGNKYNIGRTASKLTKFRMSITRTGKSIPALQGRWHSVNHVEKISGSLLGNHRRFLSGKGYCWHKNKRKWMVCICKKFYGYFGTEQEAEKRSKRSKLQ